MRHMVCDSIGAFFRMADGGQRYPYTVGISWPPVADGVVVADSALGLSGQTFLLVLKALGATQAMRLRAVCRNFDTIIGQQLKTRDWVAHEFVWKPQAYGPLSDVYLWRIDGSAGWLLDALQEERQKLTWLLLHLVRAMWDLCDQGGTPFFMSQMSATGVWCRALLQRQEDAGCGCMCRRRHGIGECTQQRGGLRSRVPPGCLSSGRRSFG